MKIIKYINKILPFFKKKNDKENFKNVLVVSNTGIGDTILGMPAIKTLRKSFPQLDITFLVNKKMYPLFEGLDFVDDSILYSTGFLNQLKLIKKLRDKKIDTIFLFHSNGPEDIFFSILSGANNILKMTNSSNHEYKDIFLNILNDDEKHIIERKIDLVRVFEPKIIDTKMEISNKFDTKKDVYKKEVDYKYIGFQLGAQDTYKIWSIQNFIQLANGILKNYKCKIILFGATKLEKNLAQELVTSVDNDNVINKCGKSTIEELPYLVKELDLLVTNDTGAMHLAIALSVPTISLFGPTDSKVYGPYQDFDIHTIIQKDGFFVNNVAKKKRSSDGINLISVDEVNLLVNKKI